MLSSPQIKSYLLQIALVKFLIRYDYLIGLILRLNVHLRATKN